MLHQFRNKRNIYVFVEKYKIRKANKGEGSGAIASVAYCIAVGFSGATFYVIYINLLLLVIYSMYSIVM